MSSKKSIPEPHESRTIVRTRTGLAEQAGAPDFGSFMRRVFPEDERHVAPETDGALVASSRQAVSLLRRDYETAFGILHRASEALPALVRQCQLLEAEVRQVRTEAEADLAAAGNEKLRWQQLAVALKNRLEESDREIAQLRKRLESSEQRVIAGRQLASAAQHKASLAIGITTLFHDKIVESFGVGSPAHSTLDALMRDALRETTRDPGSRPRKPD